MNTPLTSNIRSRIIIALIYSMTAALIDSWVSPPEPLALCSKLNLDNLIDRPAYLFLHPLFLFISLQFSQSQRFEETPFSLFLPHPSTQSTESYLKLYQNFQIYLLISISTATTILND